MQEQLDDRCEGVLNEPLFSRAPYMIPPQAAPFASKCNVNVSSWSHATMRYRSSTGAVLVSQIAESDSDWLTASGSTVALPMTPASSLVSASAIVSWNLSTTCGAQKLRPSSVEV